MWVVNRTLALVTETTTIRIPVETKERLLAHRDGDQSIGEVVTQLAIKTPINNETSRARNAIASYVYTHLVRDFGQRDELTPGQTMWADLAKLQYGDACTDHAPRAVILDHTALAAMATGRRAPAQLIHAQPGTPEKVIYVPSVAAHTAEAQQPTLSEHIDHLEKLGAITVLNFGLDAVRSVGRLVAPNATSAVLHVVHAAQPTAAWPTGIPVITVVPDIYISYKLKLYPMGEYG